ncbi:riboflavin transporter 2 [Eurytemora carolleeae]|uniref:riboflavin transporter 2 n=1 Tax=Eurytemora carolleeae TaxID=1294199 RepID=UPI000C755FBF|nr:riboflavin transporter 2 [Eurytemora carolleeae]|eukprot:XP_023330445.1 riboflavin transporter 2-like [Eurytemora affinis]
MMSFQEFIRGRVVLVDLLAVVFGISSWISINGLWVELPVLVNQLPEGWALPSYLSTIVQIANIGPIGYSLLRAFLPRPPPPHIIILIVLVLGCGASLGLALSWSVTSEIVGVERSTMLFVFVFLLSLVDCTSSVLFLPYMGLYRDVYLNSYLVGEGMSGFIPSIAALAQGVGGNPTCQNQTLTNGTTVLVPVSEEPRFTAQDFFLFLLGMMILSLTAFILLHFLPSSREEREGLIPSGRRGSGSSEDLQTQHRDKDDSGEISPRAVTPVIQPGSIYPLLVLLGAVCFLANGALPSIQSYSCLPYGNTVYHLAATLNAMANPLMAFLAMFLPCYNKKMVGLLALLGIITTSYIVATALNSPVMLWGDLGAVLTVLGWVASGALFSYVKVSIAGLCREAGALFYCGAATQIGSAGGALTAFILVTQTNLFQGYYVTC